MKFSKGKGIQFTAIKCLQGTLLHNVLDYLLQRLSTYELVQWKRHADEFILCRGCLISQV